MNPLILNSMTPVAVGRQSKATQEELNATKNESRQKPDNV